MTSKIANILKNDDKFLIVTHVNPDGDAVGSLLGLYLALKEMGKRAWPLSGEQLPDLYDFLPGSDALLTDAQATTVHPDWIVSVDVASKDRFSGDVKRFQDHARIINLDHHPTNPGFGDLNLIDSNATSTAELVFDVLKKTGYKLSADVGKCLYTGLITDTGCFRFAGVNGHTLRAAAEMLDSGFSSYDVTRPLFEEYPLTRLELERLMLERIEVLMHGRFVMSVLFADDFVRLGAAMSETDNLVNKLRENRGVEAAVLITQRSDDVYRVSFRSKGSVDVASVAKSLGGGGHRNAAGLKSTLSLPELRERILQSIGAALSL